MSVPRCYTGAGARAPYACPKKWVKSLSSTNVTEVPGSVARGLEPVNRSDALVVVRPDSCGPAAGGTGGGHGGLTLLCLPQIGGGVSTFYGWKGLFGTDVRLVAVRLPGRESRMREAPYCRAEDAVSELVAAIDADGAQRLALFGHCSGAVIAYALALELEKRGRPCLEGLYVSSFGPPRAEGNAAGTEIYRLDDAELLRHVEQLDGTPARVMDNPQLMAMVMPKLRADFELMETYLVPARAARLQCPLVLFAADHDRTLGRPEVAEWGSFVAQPPALHQVEGGHFSALPAVGEILSRLLAG